MAAEDEREDCVYKTESTCLKLYHDDDGGKVEVVSLRSEGEVA